MTTLAGFSPQGGKRIKDTVEWKEAFVMGKPQPGADAAPGAVPSLFVQIREHDGDKYGWKRVKWGEDGPETIEWGKALYSDPFHAKERSGSEVVPIGAFVWIHWSYAGYYWFEFRYGPTVVTLDEDIDTGGTASLDAFSDIEVAVSCLGPWKAGKAYAMHEEGEWRIIDAVAPDCEEDE